MRLLLITLVGLMVALVPASAHASKAGTTIKDCDVCPELVIVPAGNFMMGSNDGRSEEKPARKVTIGAPLAVGKFEVTFAEWDACVADGGCKYKPGDQGWGRGQRPVMSVSWDDITKQYLPWLSRKTSKRYRLLTEAEWEYAARAGTTTKYAFGNTISESQAQFSKVSWGSAGKTATVGSFKSNAFGLHDMHGNVFEWVQDCYKDSYSGAPTDGSAVTTGKCWTRVLRGGSWINRPRFLRSAYRLKHDPVIRDYSYGFRVVRMLTP